MNGNTIRYRVEDTEGRVLSVYSKKKNAIKKAIRFALEFRGARFIVVHKTFKTQKRIFSFSFDAEFDFPIVTDVYSGFAEVFESKSKKMKGWFTP